MPPPSTAEKTRLIDARLLARWPLPHPARHGDKEERGTVLIVAGSPQMPGAAILAATAALRAGAGKLQIAACRSIAPIVAAAVPEAYVVSLRESRSGCVDRSSIGPIARHAENASAVLLGPGMVGEDAMQRWLPRLLASLAESKATLVLDAAPLAALASRPGVLRPFRGRVVITPHAGEMAAITGLPKSDVMRNPEAIARRVASSLRAVVALKGAVTHVVSPEGQAYRNEAGNVGLATSGSGDALSGVLAGLAARGADALRATVWAVHAHACAADCLAARNGGPLGFLARELLAEIPCVLARLSRAPRRRRR